MEQCAKAYIFIFKKQGLIVYQCRLKPYRRTPLPLVGEGRVRVSMWQILALIKHMTGRNPHPALSRKRERGFFGVPRGVGEGVFGVPRGVGEGFIGCGTG